MLYFSAFLIAFGISVVNVSLLPHFWMPIAQIVFVLPFLSIYSLKDKTIFSYLLAVTLGVYYDTLTASSFPVFSVTFLLVTMVGKSFFSKITSYGVERTGWLLTLMGYGLILFSDWQRIGANLTHSGLYLQLATNLLFLFVWQLVLYRALTPYFDWVEKFTSERFR